LPKTGFAELAWTPGAAELAIEAKAQGSQPVNDVNSDFAASYVLAALRASWRADLGPGILELQARVDNLTNRRVAGSVIVGETNGRFFEPAAERNGSLSLRWRQRF
jgi:iron complex outermembrane recepter protein